MSYTDKLAYRHTI